MNKMIVPIVIILLLLLGVGGFLFMNMQNKSQQQPAETESARTGPGSEQDVFTSIKDALSKSVSLECTYKDDAGAENKTYIKAGAVRTMMTAKNTDDPNNFIMKDSKMYSWNETSKKGFMMKFEIPKDISPLPTSAVKGEQPTENQGESYLAQIEKYKDACKPGVVDESLFTPPADVTFQDYSSMMEKVQEQMKDVQKDNSKDSEEIKKLMEQYGGSSQ